MKTRTITLLLALSFCAGCLPAAVAYTAYEVSNARENSAKTQAQAWETRDYANYCTEMERVNLDREKAGLKPKPILSLQEWKATLK
jgi:hypothetical protein